MHHVNVNGSAEFLEDTSVLEIKDKIFELYSNKEKYNIMKDAARKHAIRYFSYRDIAKRAIGIENE